MPTVTTKNTPSSEKKTSGKLASGAAVPTPVAVALVVLILAGVMTAGYYFLNREPKPDPAVAKQSISDAPGISAQRQGMVNRRGGLPPPDGK